MLQIKPHNLIFITAILLTGVLPVKGQKKFSFFAIGDMPYHNPADIDKFKQLTKAINTEKAAFTVHVGDIKSGSAECSDAYFSMMLEMFNQFKEPLIYTPGDNEWTDCNREKAGGYNPVERLTKLRELYFKNHKSLGQKPLQFISQDQSPGYEKFVENVAWRKEGITFGTVHVVGSNNNFKAKSGNENEEFTTRDKANVQWLGEIFKMATNSNDAAIVIIMHAALNYSNKEANGFTNIISKLRTEVKAFNKPVLLIYGDHHNFLISKPLMDANDNLIQNFTALMVFGDQDMNAVKIHVDPKSKAVFSFTEYLMDY